MTIRLLSAISIAGVSKPIGTSLTLDAALEADLVNRGDAVYTRRSLSPGEGLVAAQFAIDDSGNVTRMVGPDGETLMQFVDVGGESTGANVEV